ncbi:MAG: hypothetical protein DI598_15405, partial [Pseudopedobacter saltans]
KKYLFFIPFLLLALSLSSYTNAQNTQNFSGTVKNGQNEPIPHATVLVEHHYRYKAVADSNGFFRFSLSDGTYTIKIHAVGYESHTQQISVPSESNINFTLKPSSNSNLSDVTINGLGKGVEKHRIETSGYAVNVIETKDAALQNIQTIDLLDRSAGVRVRQNGGLGGTVEYNINGLSGNAVKIFIDGIPISNYGRSFSLNSIPPALIERMEVYKGVIPGHLSEDALGGAINVILKKGMQNNFTTSYSFGSFNTHQWNATGSYQLKNSLIVKGSAFYNYSDNSYKVWGDDILYYEADGSTSGPHKAKRFNDAYDSKSLKLDFGFVNKKWADQFFVGGLISDQMKKLQHGVSMRMVYGNRHSRQNSKVGSLIYTKNNLFVKGLSVNVNSSYSYLERENIDTIGDRFDWRGTPIINPNTGLPVQYANGAEQSSIGKTLSVNSEKTFVARSNISYALNDNNAVFANILYNTFKRGVDDSFRDEIWRNFQNTRDLTKQIYSFTYQNIAFDGKLRSNVFYKSYNQKVNSHEP